MRGFTATTFRTVGNAATTQTLMVIKNASTDKVVSVKQLTANVEASAALATFGAQILTSKATVVSAGTALTKTALPSGSTLDSGVTVIGATASDGGAATAITAILGAKIWQRFMMRVHTAVGQVLPDEMSLLPLKPNGSDSFDILPGEALAVHIIAAAGTSNPATNHYIINVLAEEIPA